MFHPHRRRARELRGDQSDAESLLWRRLRDRQLSRAKFRRQHPIGPFIADFCCVEVRLVVEVDGGQHAERSREDERRTAYLESRGYRVVRFWNNEVLGETEAVMEQIYGEVDAARGRLEERKE